MDPLAPIPKLDAGALVTEVNASAGLGLQLLGPAPGGEVGAAYVRLADGRDGVLTTTPVKAAEIERTREVLDLARRAGIPTPRYEHVVELSAATAIVQERLPGSNPATIDRPLVDAMLTINARFENLLADRPDLPAPNLYLRESGPGYCVHESLAGYDHRTRRLLEWVHQVGADGPTQMDGNDLVHMDFHFGNVLVNGNGVITGVVDWHQAWRGDRRFDLVTLRFDGLRSLDRGIAAWLDDIIDSVLPPEILRRYWAHMSLRLVDWAIRHHSASVVDGWLDLAATRMDG
jgi:hypothetical protein